MKKATKVWLIIATVLLVSGMLVFTLSMSMNDWSFSKLSTVQYTTNTHEISEDFHSISINTDTAAILFLPSENETCQVICYEEEKQTHTVKVQNGTLTVGKTDEEKWYDHIHIGISFESPKITVLLPKAEYTSLLIKESTGDIKIPKDFLFESIDVSASTGAVRCDASAKGAVRITTSTGSIHVENAVAEKMEISVSTGAVNVTSTACARSLSIRVSTGKVTLTDVTCNDLVSDGDTGDLHLKNVLAAGQFTIERDTGDVRFEGCDAAEISVTTDTGDITGTLLTDKIFFANSDTGKVDVPKTVTGGRCELTTDTGKIHITISGEK